MSWQQLLASNRARKHRTSKAELDALRAVIQRDLRDAAVAGLSSDRCFATAYNAALQTAKLAVACAGYRVSGQGAHQTSFEAVELAIGSSSVQFAAYFETCRRKRYTLDYDAAFVTSDMEAKEILQKTEDFRQQVEAWIAKHHPQFAI